MEWQFNWRRWHWSWYKIGDTERMIWMHFAEIGPFKFQWHSLLTLAELNNPKLPTLFSNYWHKDKRDGREGLDCLLGLWHD